jgi:hypothetical protein
MSPRISVPNSWGVTRRLGTLALVATLAALALALLAPPARASLPPQGLYEQCAPNSTTMDCGERLRTMAQAGFRYVLNYMSWYGSADEVLRFADQAEAAGLEVIWPLNHDAWRNGADLRRVYPYLAPDCGCGSSAEFKRYAIGLVKDHPATWGFYVGDEEPPNPVNIDQVAALSQEVAQIAPGMPRLYISLQGTGLQDYLAPFIPYADYAGADYYPVGRAPDLRKVPLIARQTHDLTSDQGKRSALVLQAFSWSQYDPSFAPRFPTRGEMRWMRDAAISHGNPDMVLWYSYNDLFTFDSPEARWSDLKAAAFAPHIQLRRMPSRCVASRFKLRVRVKLRATTKVWRVRALVDGKQVRVSTKRRFTARVNARKLRAGRHRVRVLAVDWSGHRSTRRHSFRRCRA